jgi:shikimate dehydrogenase
MSTALRFAVLGTPIGHSKSPTMHAAAYRAYGLPHTYERLDTSEPDLVARVGDLRAGRFAGLNVTVPHKARVLALVDEVDASARGVVAANTLVRLQDGRVRAHNTDVPALVSELRRVGRLGDAEDALAGRTALVLGSGGAARAAVAACAALGAARIAVRARRADPDVVRALETASAGVPLLVEELGSRGVEAHTRVIVQATSCGMAGGPDGRVVADAVAWSTLPSDTVALDVVYGAATPFLVAARGRGLAADDGLGMLATQGALAFSLWLGLPPPIEIMRDALTS